MKINYIVQVSIMKETGKMILDWFLDEMGWEGVDWMHLAQDRDKWQALVNTLLNLWVP
jgi:hypothetical protein